MWFFLQELSEIFKEKVMNQFSCLLKKRNFPVNTHRFESRHEMSMYIWPQTKKSLHQL